VSAGLLLEVEHVDASYGEVQALWDISLEVAPGEVVALIGANGAGKSTCLRVISGLLSARRGHVRVDGQDITGLTPECIVALGITQVPQGRRLFADLSTRENLLLGAYLRSDRAAVLADLDRVLRFFPVLRPLLDRSASQLSGGEQQMAALARGMMACPRLLLIDEPSLGLAPIAVRELMKVIGRLRGEGMSVLLVEQDVTLALGRADRGYVLETGRIVLTDTAAALMASERLRTAYLGLDARESAL